LAGARSSFLRRGQDEDRLDDGFDFLGFAVRRYDGKLLTNPAWDMWLRLL
jgi:hypothetical protein